MTLVAEHARYMPILKFHFVFAWFEFAEAVLALGNRRRIHLGGSQDLATILDPFRTIFADLGPGRQMSAVETGQMSSVSTADICTSEAAWLS